MHGRLVGGECLPAWLFHIFVFVKLPVGNASQSFLWFSWCVNLGHHCFWDFWSRLMILHVRCLGLEQAELMLVSARLRDHPEVLCLRFSQDSSHKTAFLSSCTCFNYWVRLEEKEGTSVDNSAPDKKHWTEFQPVQLLWLTALGCCDEQWSKSALNSSSVGPQNSWFRFNTHLCFASLNHMHLFT